MEILKEATIQIGSGGTAGFIEVCLMHPLDLIKTRLQLQSGKSLSKSDPNHYTGILDCFAKMYKNEGLSSFWKGIIPPIVAETPKRAVKFFTFEQYKKLFMFGHEKPTPLTFSLAGLGAGLTEAVLVNPFEVVKVTMQADRKKGTTLGTWGVTKLIYQKEGLKGLNKGVSATMARNGAYNMIYFGWYHSVKGYFPEFKDPWKEFFRKISIGFFSGIIGSCANIPFDVAKSRIQGPQPVPGQIKYRHLLPTMVLVYKEEGFRALYKGLLPKVIRLGPGGAIMLVVYEYMHEFLTEKLR